MRERPACIVAALVAVVLSAGCRTLGPSPGRDVSTPHAPVILGTAIIAPDALVNVVTETARADRGGAPAIAAVAASGAPDQSAAIRSAVISVAPAEATAVAAATRTTRTAPAVTRVAIPNPDRLALLVADATSLTSGELAEPPRFGAGGMSRLGAEITRALLGVGRSVRQLVDDLR